MFIDETDIVVIVLGFHSTVVSDVILIFSKMFRNTYILKGCFIIRLMSQTIVRMMTNQLSNEV